MCKAATAAELAYDSAALRRPINKVISFMFHQSLIGMNNHKFRK
jgi:hypothetical protein